VGEGWALTPEAAGIAEADHRAPSSAPIEAWVSNRVFGGALMIGGRNFSPRPATVSFDVAGGSLSSLFPAFEAPPGAFLRLFRLPNVEPAPTSDFVRMLVRSSPESRVAIEQFDAVTALDSRAAWGFGVGWQEQEFNPRTGLRWRWLSERGELRLVDEHADELGRLRPRSLAEELAAHDWRQLHVAETEKYAHVTYFFNGGREAPLPGEDRRLVPSPKVATYDLQPEMSASGVTDALIGALASDAYDLVVTNLANPDMVGHTGVWTAAVAAAETVDACLGRVVAALAALDATDPTGPGSLLAVTADHGNADQMRDAYGDPVTAHSLNPVPFLLVGRAVEGRTLRDGVLADVGPTLCELAGLPRWDGITGTSLLEPSGRS
jgi:hypothetical protein